MNLHDYQILESAETFSLDNMDPILRRSAANGGDLRWNKDGDTRTVPNAVLMHAIALYDDWKKAEDQIGCLIPADARSLRWEQAVGEDRNTAKTEDPP